MSKTVADKGKPAQHKENAKGGAEHRYERA
jgi:hypothetical protein